MAIHDELGCRMKNFYELSSRTRLVRRMPVAIRIDGKAFHTFTREFEKPFDRVLMRTMQETMKYLCENIQGCVLGYTQSDEINLILIDYKNLTSCAWFDYEVQKICSIGASMATMAFNRNFLRLMKEGKALLPVYEQVAGLAMFDARCFNIPREEVTNLIYWRQLDASRNSIQMVGHACFSHKELQNRSCSEIQDMLMLQKGINWNDYPAEQKRGSCCIRAEQIVETERRENSDGQETAEKRKDKDSMGKRMVIRYPWMIDREIPIFKGEGRDYIEKLIDWEG